MTPVLVFLGIPPTVAVASQANHVVASSISGVTAYSRRQVVDFRMGGVLAAGGVVGAFVGVEVFRLLRLLGQADLVVALSYLLFLGVIGVLMLYESLGAILRRRRGESAAAATDRRPSCGCTACREDAVSPSRPLHQRHPAARCWACSSASCRPSWASAAASSWCRRCSTCCGCRPAWWSGPACSRSSSPPRITTVLQAGRNQTVDIVLSTLLLVGGVVGAQSARGLVAVPGRGTARGAGPDRPAGRPAHGAGPVRPAGGALL